MECHIGFYATVDIKGRDVDEILSKFESAGLWSRTGQCFSAEVQEIKEITRIDDGSYSDLLNSNEDE